MGWTTACSSIDSSVKSSPQRPKPTSSTALVVPRGTPAVQRSIIPPGASTSRSSSSASTLGRSPSWPSDSAAHSRAVAQPRAKSPPQHPVQHPGDHRVAGADPVEDDHLAGGHVRDLVGVAVPAHQAVAAHRHDDEARAAHLAHPAQHGHGLALRHAERGHGVREAAAQHVDVGDQRQRHAARLLGRPQPGAVVDVVADAHAGLAGAARGLEHQRLRVAGQREGDAGQVQQAGVEQVVPVDLVRLEVREAGVAPVEVHLDGARRHSVLDVVGRQPPLGPAHGAEVDAGDPWCRWTRRPSGESGSALTQPARQPSRESVSATLPSVPET
jgi:hypothetical protein